MKKAPLWLMVLFMFRGSVLRGQDITGAWQGALKAGSQELRIVLKISEDDKKLKAVSYSIDQGGAPIPATAITQSGPGIKDDVRLY